MISISEKYEHFHSDIAILYNNGKGAGNNNFINNSANHHYILIYLIANQ
jgi:hypothetical protein